MKARLILPILLLTLLLALSACSGRDGRSGGDGAGDTDAGNTVHMNSTDFVTSSVTIPRGSSLTLVADTIVPHFISNGTWEEGTANPVEEPEAPQVDEMQILGNNSGTLGPFAAAGTFHYYCTIHPGMELTVTVE